MKYSLWLVPPEPVFNKLAQLIKASTSQYQGPVFMPHISLLYGDHEMTTREKMATAITLENFSFTIDKIHIMPEDSNPIKWKAITVVPFKIN